MEPVRLAPNPVQHFYRGGGRIAALRGFTPISDHQPEEWVAATVSRFGHAGAGLALTEDGTALRDLVAGDPESWLPPRPAGGPRPRRPGVVARAGAGGESAGHRLRHRPAPQAPRRGSTTARARAPRSRL